METFFGNIFGVILVIAFFLGFILFLQFISKASGKNIRQKYGSSTIRPDDFDDSIKLIKKTTDEINFKIKTLGLTKFEKIILKFEKILNSSNQYKYSVFCIKSEQYSKLKEKDDNDKAELGRILSGTPRATLPNIFDEPMSMSERAKMIRLQGELTLYVRYFQNSDVLKIMNFIAPALENDNNKSLEFIDLLGCENVRPFVELIVELENCFLKNEINSHEINNIKKLILVKKGLIETLI